jgi:hypothetical protein
MIEPGEPVRTRHCSGEADRSNLHHDRPEREEAPWPATNRTMRKTCH